ncbi:MAG: hypothetical protein L7S64_10270 [Longimicrobiales bacterium]|nr:hypothetical protein [Longimicrobiales bacterium]
MPRDSWTPDPFIRTNEVRNVVAAKSRTALDVRDGGEEFMARIEEWMRTITVVTEAL